MLRSRRRFFPPLAAPCLPAELALDVSGTECVHVPLLVKTLIYVFLPTGAW